MLTLITGTPGSGKTAWTVQELTRLPSQRKVYVHGIPELKLPHEKIYCRSDLCDVCDKTTEGDDDIFYSHVGPFGPLPENRGWPVITGRLYVEDWPLWATHGSLIVIDEVQRIWRPTNAAAKLPDDISRLETHRHMGLDFWLISQGPHLFHSNIRLLIGRHIHLVAKWNGRSEYEWPECRQNVSSRGDAVTRPYSLPKHIFHLYKSSSLHVKQTHRKPLAFYGFFASLALLVVMVFFGFKRVTAHMEPTAPASSQQPAANVSSGPAVSASQKFGAASSGAPGGLAGAGSAVAGAASSSLGVRPGQAPAYPDFKPTIEGVPESAPAYSGMLTVKAAPTLAGCIKTKTECKCYTGQATPYQVSPEFCDEYLKGHRFNPYLTPKSAPPVQAQTEPKESKPGKTG